jgi:anti-sigma factor RsiW
MTCADAAPLLDAFVDAELPAPTLLAVARHAGACAACDAALRDLASLHDAVERSVAGPTAALDLSGVWPAVAAAAARHDAGRAWRISLKTVPTWGAIAALAAGAVLWLRSAALEPTRVAARPRPNHAVIERIDSAGARFELRRERKNGTTLIMVSADGGTLP